ncbi:MAG: hypothetical protein AB1567_03420 [bacterium]
MPRYDYNKSISPLAPGLNITFFPSTGLLRSPFKIKRWAKIDTGADVTLIPHSILWRVGVKTEKNVEVESFDGVPKKRPTFKVNFEVAGYKYEREVISSPGKSILLGRDILNQWKLILNGCNLKFEIEKCIKK